jgi:hypothetical protein
MAKRPVFFVQDPNNQDAPLVDVVLVDFKWSPGMAKSQKQKSINSLHESIHVRRPCRVLEISSKSQEDLGIKLSAFNLGFVHPKSNAFICVESAFQGSKVFESSGPFPELYAQSAREAKKFFKDKELGSLIRFDFYGKSWPINPMTLFYDWLYLNSLYRNPVMSKQTLEYDCFTDIEFNPRKSINCQAYSAALFVSLARRGLLDDALENRNAYLSLLQDVQSWIRSTEYSIFHEGKQQRLL